MGGAATGHVNVDATRVRLAAGDSTPTATLLELAGDASVAVRAALALRARATPDLDDLLAADRDAPVRVLLARRLAAALPQHSADGHAELADRATATLERLVADEAEQVRAAIADSLLGWPAAPRSLVLRLARDSVIAVSDPVIRLSQTLTQADLLQLLAESTASGVSVAMRSGLSEAVADAVVATADTAAITALLGNPTAAIREATLDALVAQSAGIVAFQAPLVRRPLLPPGAALLLSRIVTADLLAVLAERVDLPAELLARLRDDLGRRLTEESALTTEPPNEAAFAAALAADRRWYAMSILAAAAKVPFAAIDHVADHKNVKALLSLLWQAGFSMQVAPAAQAAIAQVAPGQRLLATPEGGFPLSDREMIWQIELIIGIPATGSGWTAASAMLAAIG